jgi:alkyl hydroperoxide reductase subunit AhpC
MAARNGFTSPVVADPKCAIADLFNSLNPLNHRHAPGFFVIDEQGTIRALQHGPLPSSIEMLMVSARGLGRALPESAWTWVTE